MLLFSWVRGMHPCMCTAPIRTLFASRNTLRGGALAAVVFRERLWRPTVIGVFWWCIRSAPSHHHTLSCSTSCNCGTYITKSATIAVSWHHCASCQQAPDVMELGCCWMLLPTFFPMGTVELECVGLFKDIFSLTIGPQYLNQRLGQEHYLVFVMKVFQSCDHCLTEPSRTAFCVWWLRFERLLIVLDRLGVCRLPQSRRKKVKSTVKDFLKWDRNRNNLLFYHEYALIEWVLGNRDGSC